MEPRGRAGSGHKWWRRSCCGPKLAVATSAASRLAASGSWKSADAGPRAPGTVSQDATANNAAALATDEGLAAARRFSGGGVNLSSAAGTGPRQLADEKMPPPMPFWLPAVVLPPQGKAAGASVTSSDPSLLGDGVQVDGQAGEARAQRPGVIGVAHPRHHFDGGD